MPPIDTYPFPRRWHLESCALRWHCHWSSSRRRWSDSGRAPFLRPCCCCRAPRTCWSCRQPTCLNSTLWLKIRVSITFDLLLYIWPIAALWLYHSWNRSVVLWLSLINVDVAISTAALAVLERLGGLYHWRLVCGHGLCGGGDFVVHVL